MGQWLKCDLMVYSRGYLEVSNRPSKSCAFLAFDISKNLRLSYARQSQSTTASPYIINRGRRTWPVRT